MQGKDLLEMDPDGNTHCETFIAILTQCYLFKKKPLKVSEMLPVYTFIFLRGAIKYLETLIVLCLPAKCFWCKEE